MSNSPKAKRKPSSAAKPPLLKVELEPDAMERFERAIGVMAPARRKKPAGTTRQGGKAKQ
jgi:hypothetical protein